MGSLVSSKYIHLSRGYRAKVSVDDYEWLKHYTWYADVEEHTVYAKTAVTKYREDGTPYQSTVRMHRLITRAPLGMDVDHINKNGLDNRRENLRVLHSVENQQNRVYGIVAFRGVVRVKRKGGWVYRAKITNPVSGKREHLGYFKEADRAARAYDMRAIELYGQFYGLNFPRETYGLHGAITHPIPDPLFDIPF